MAYQAIPESASSGTGDSGLEAFSMSVAADALGVDPEQLVGGFYNIGFYGGDVYAAFSQAGTGARVGIAQKLRLNTGTTNSSHCLISPSLVTSANAPKPLQIGAAKKWWVGGVYALSLTPPIVAGDAGGIILHESTVGFIGHIGFHATASTANFGVNIFGGSGGSIDSTVAFDTSARLHEFWRNGTTGTYRTTLATLMRGTLGAGVTGDIRHSVIATIGAGMQISTGGVDLQADYEWIAAWAERE